MMNVIWGIILIISVACSIITGKISELSTAVLTGTSDAISLIISISGMMALWTGLMKIAQSAGLTSLLSKLFSPIIKIIFPDFSPESPAAQSICMNITANLLGLGNAATPFGINAMKEMQKLNSSPAIATNSMVMFVVINTASLQLFPTCLCILRQKNGSANPLDTLPTLWIASTVALIAGITVTKIFEKVGKKKNG